MFWNKVAGLYDLFENLYNGKVNQALCRKVAAMIDVDDRVQGQPDAAIKELERVCRPGGKIIIPTYVNKTAAGTTKGVVKLPGKAGAGVTRQFAYQTYQEFFAGLGYQNVQYTFVEGKMPCTIAVITK